MEKAKKIQKARDNAAQIQTEVINFHIGITEERARDIFDERIAIALSNHSSEAQEIAKNRIKIFEDDLLPKIIKQNLLGHLKDPSIQMVLIDAQKTAAQTERDIDYSLLSELLIHRMQKGNDNSYTKTGINRAVGIIDEISDEALLAVTIAHAISTFFPTTGSIKEGLKTLDSELFNYILYDKLPQNNDWIEQLDILDAIRINSLGSLKKLEQWYPSQMPGYVQNGIKKESENYSEAIRIIKEVNLPINILVEHELNNDYVRIPVINKDNIDELFLNIPISGQFIRKPLTQLQNESAKRVYDLYEKNDDVYKLNIDSFIKMWDSFSNLKVIRAWWNNINTSFTITKVGKVIAHANAQRCNPKLPSLDN